MKNVIGFATQFYTLWDYEVTNEYKTDAYGNHHCVGQKHSYYYIKNVSTDIDKVKQLYPTTPIDETLRGKINSFDFFKSQDLPGNYFWGGKYVGKLVDEIMDSDFQYCLWSANNYGGATTGYIKNHPKYIAHFEAIEKAKQELIDSTPILKVGDVVEIDLTSNGYNADDDYTECWASAMYGEVELSVKCSGVKPVDGMYPYLMPILNGKAQRTKRKTVQITVTEVLETVVITGIVKQLIKAA